MQTASVYLPGGSTEIILASSYPSSHFRLSSGLANHHFSIAISKMADSKLLPVCCDGIESPAQLLHPRCIITRIVSRWLLHN